jgi:hypothetical protein
MKLRLLPTALLSLTAILSPAYAASGGCGSCCAAPVSTSTASKTGKLVEVTEQDAAWAAKARESYPLKTCVVSDEALGSMGKSPEYIYRVDGKPDRLVKFCCDGCQEDFLKNPEAALAKLEKPAKAAGAKKGDSAHSQHAH